MQYRLALVLPYVAWLCIGCASNPRNHDGQFLTTPYKSPERVRAALNVMPQQLQQGGQLWETYIVGDEQITVHYQFVKRP